MIKHVTTYLLTPTKDELEEFHRVNRFLDQYTVISTAVQGERLYITYTYKD